MTSYIQPFYYFETVNGIMFEYSVIYFFLLNIIKGFETILLSSVQKQSFFQKRIIEDRKIEH